MSEAQQINEPTQGRPWLLNMAMKGMQAGQYVFNHWDRWVNKSVIQIPMDFQDPYTDWAELQRRGSVLRSVTNRGWMVFGYDEVKELARDPRLGNNVGDNKFIRRFMQAVSGKDEVVFFDYPSLQQVNPPDHTRLRKLLTPGFVVRYIESLEPMIVELCEEMINALPEDKPFDLVADFAKPLPARVIAHMLGVPQQDYPLFEKLSSELLGIVELESGERVLNGLQAFEGLRDYMIERVAQMQRNPGDDFISLLIAAEEEGDKLTADELYSASILLLVAGHETTTRLITSAVAALLDEPEQLAEVRASDDLLQRALEESLRLQAPVLFLPRIVLEDFDYQGKRFKKGQFALLSLASANRDPKVFTDPDRFDLHRQNLNHVSFGHGIHLCLGITLARLEARVAVRTLLNKFNSLQQVDHAQWQRSPMFRGLETLMLQGGG